MSLENLESISYGKLQDIFYSFVKVFVTLEEKMKKISSIVHEMYNQRKQDQLQKNIDNLKKEIDFSIENTEVLGKLFKSNLDFLLDAMQETTFREKQLLQENMNLKHELEIKVDAMIISSQQLQDHTTTASKLSDKLNKLQEYIRLLESECRDKDIELEMRLHHCNKVRDGFNELKKKNKDAEQTFTIQKKLFTYENALLTKKVVKLEKSSEKYSNSIAREANEYDEIVDQRLMNLSEEIENSRLENEKKRSVINQLNEEIVVLKKESKLHIGMLTTENVMLQKLINDQDLKKRQMLTETHDKGTFKEKAIQNGLLELHSKLSKVKKENIIMREDFDKKELEYKRRVLDLEEELRKKERNTKLYEEYIIQARDVISKLRSITI